MKRNTFSDITFQQMMTTPFRPETGVPMWMHPVYSSETPIVPPYLPYRRSSFYPHYSSYKQLKSALPPQNLIFTKGD